MLRASALAHGVRDLRRMKLVLSGFLALAVFTGATGTTGPLKDEWRNIFVSRDELTKAHAEVADLRNGRGFAAPDWLTDYAKAICVHNAEYVESHTDPSLGMTREQVQAQFDTMHARGLDCTAVRYLGSVNGTQFIYVLRQGPKEVWYVFTLSDDGLAVVNVE
jgi:hypothetical protein